jgi:hypothetical protein
MATQPNTSAKTPKAPAKPILADDMTARRTFYPTRDESGDVISSALEQAQEYLAGIMERFDDFDDYPFAASGVSLDDEGNAVFDESVYAEDSGVMVGLLKKNKEGVKCTFMAPIPDFPAMVADTVDGPAQSWAVAILEKEANHVAVRALREAEDVSLVVDQMPASADSYFSSGRGAGAGIMATFNELYKAINALLASKVPAWAKAKLYKSEMQKAMESKAYAMEYYQTLEDRGERESLFVLACNMGIRAAAKKGMDPTIFERWLATRNEKPFKLDATDEGEDDFDLDSLTESLLAEPAKPATEQAEPAEGEGTDSTDEEPATE